MLSQPIRQRLGPVSQPRSECGFAVSPKGFLPVRPTQKALDDHVRKLPGADASGDAVSVELLQNAETLVFSHVGLRNTGFRRGCGTRAPPSLCGVGRGASTVGDSDLAIRTFSLEGKLPG